MCVGREAVWQVVEETKGIRPSLYKASVSDFSGEQASNCHSLERIRELNLY